MVKAIREIRWSMRKRKYWLIIIYSCIIYWYSSLASATLQKLTYLYSVSLLAVQVASHTPHIRISCPHISLSQTRTSEEICEIRGFGAAARSSLRICVDRVERRRMGQSAIRDIISELRGTTADDPAEVFNVPFLSPTKSHPMLRSINK
jgi:hypothetical protein